MATIAMRGTMLIVSIASMTSTCNEFCSTISSDDLMALRFWCISATVIGDTPMLPELLPGGIVAARPLAVCPAVVVVVLLSP